MPIPDATGPEPVPMAEPLSDWRLASILWLTLTSSWLIVGGGMEAAAPRPVPWIGVGPTHDGYPRSGWWFRLVQIGVSTPGNLRRRRADGTAVTRGPGPPGSGSAAGECAAGPGGRAGRSLRPHRGPGPDQAKLPLEQQSALLHARGRRPRGAGLPRGTLAAPGRGHHRRGRQRKGAR